MNRSANIRGGRVIDPVSGRDEVGDVFIADGKFVPAPASDAVGCAPAPDGRNFFKIPCVFLRAQRQWKGARASRPCKRLAWKARR